MGLFSPKDKELEAILKKIELAMSNNYKDMAQANFTDFKNLYEAKYDKLSEKSRDYYNRQRVAMEVKLRGFHHKREK